MKPTYEIARKHALQPVVELAARLRSDDPATRQEMLAAYDR